MTNPHIVSVPYSSKLMGQKSSQLYRRLFWSSTRVHSAVKARTRARSRIRVRPRSGRGRAIGGRRERERGRGREGACEWSGGGDVFSFVPFSSSVTDMSCRRRERVLFLSPLLPDQTIVVITVDVDCPRESREQYGVGPFSVQCSW